MWFLIALASAYELAENVTGDDYNRAGVDINDALHLLSKELKKPDGDPTKVLHPDFSGGSAGSPQGVVLRSGIEVLPWAIDTVALADRDAAASWWKQLRAQFTEVEKFAMKLVDIERIDSDLTTQMTFRFEIWGTDPEGRRVQVYADAIGFWKDHLGTSHLASFQMTSGETTRGRADLFADVATEHGLDFFGHPDPRFLPPSDELKFQTARHSIGGAAAGDIDGDGDDDLLMLGGEAPRLFENTGGSFKDATEAWGLSGHRTANVAAFADFDNDGDQDLFLGWFYGRNLLFENTGTRFSDVTEKSGLAQDEMVAVASPVDVNGDGALDLYLGRYLDAKARVPDMIHYTRNGEPNRLYLGDGALHFRDVSEASGADDRGLTLGIAAADYDQDGDQDLYLANDFGRNVLLRNRGDGTFEDVAKQTGTLAISGGMSASFGDYDGDGWLDLYVASIRSNQRWYSQDLNIRGYVLGLVESPNRSPSLEATFLDLREALGDDWDKVGQFELSGNYLFRNRGDGSFEDVSMPSGTRKSGWYWGTAFLDFDNDGNLDLLAANGWITGKDEHDL